MDPVQIVAERKIADAIDDGAFDRLPQYGRIDCSLQGERFIAEWWRRKVALQYIEYATQPAR